MQGVFEKSFTPSYNPLSFTLSSLALCPTLLHSTARILFAPVHLCQIEFTLLQITMPKLSKVSNL